MATRRAQHRLIPNEEGQFDQFARQFVECVAAEPETYGLSAERVQSLQDNLTSWDAGYLEATKARDAAKAATVVKEQAKTELEDVIRSAARMIQANDDITDGDREKAGLPVHKTTRTPVPVPSTCPTASVVATERLQHTLMFSDVMTPTRRAKPYGVNAAEVYVLVADNPSADPEDYRFVTLATRTPEVVNFKPEDGGKMANYLLRWVNTKGEPGPWSQVVSATVPAV